MNHKPGSLEEAAQRVLLGESTEKKLQELLDKFFGGDKEGEYTPKRGFIVEYKGYDLLYISIKGSNYTIVVQTVQGRFPEKHKNLDWLKDISVYKPRNPIWKG